MKRLIKPDRRLFLPSRRGFIVGAVSLLAAPAVVKAQLLTTGAGKAPGGGGGGTLTYTPTATATVWQTSANPMTFSGISIGTASSDRIVVVTLAAITSTNPADISGVTIGGSAAAKAVGNTISNLGAGCHIWYLLVTSGTTANIVITAAAGTILDCDVVVGNITGSASATTGPTNAVAWAASADPHSLTASIPANGVGVMGCVIDRNATITWTNATGDASINETGSSALAMSGAHGTNNSPSFSGANGFTTASVMATFGP